MCKISIIIPVYNTEKFIERCLKSIVNQSLKEIEIIVVNDGSTDNSLELIRKFEKIDKRLKVIDKKNGGLSSARNAGIEEAKGEYLLHIDSDDWIEQDYLKDIYSFAKEKRLDIVVTDFYLDYDDGNLNYMRDIKLKDKEILSEKEYLKKLLIGEGYPCVWNKLFKSYLYKKTNIRHPLGISLGEDLGTTPLLVNKSKKIGKINKAYLHYIQNPNSITKSGKLKKIDELFSVLEKLRMELSNIVEDRLLNSLVINNIGNVFYSENFINNYSKEAGRFLDMIKEIPEIETVSKKNKLFFKILKVFPTLLALNTIRKINLFLIKIKKIQKGRVILK